MDTLRGGTEAVVSTTLTEKIDAEASAMHQTFPAFHVVERTVMFVVDPSTVSFCLDFVESIQPQRLRIVPDGT